MQQAPITHFELDPYRLATLQMCMAGDPGFLDGEWSNNVLSKRTVVYGSGRIARSGVEISHAVDPAELQLCRRLSSEIATLMAGTEVSMGSEAGYEFDAFYIAGNVGEPVPAKISEAVIWERFGGTIFPPTRVTVEALVEDGVWWKEIEADYVYDDEVEKIGSFAPWRRMIEWFRTRAAFVDSVFVRIGNGSSMFDIPEEEFPDGTDFPGVVFPRLALGLTPGGSLIGLFGACVQT